MHVRRTVLATLLAAGAAFAPSANAAPAVTPFYPMVIIQVDGVVIPGPDSPRPRFSVAVQAPAGWSCFDSWDPRQLQYDATCLPPAAPPGMQNVCGWVASIASLEVNRTGPLTTAACGAAQAISGGGEGLVGVATSNQTLNSLQCRLNLQFQPPGTPFQARCTTNH